MRPPHDDYSTIIALCDENLDERPRHDQPYIDAVIAELDDIDLSDIPDDPAPVAVQTKSSESLSDDDLSAVADLERRQLPDWAGLFRRVKDEKAAKRKTLLLPQRRQKTAARVRKHRENPKSVLRLHLTTLFAATSTANGDKFLWTLIGREKEIVRFWVVQSDARRKFGAKASLSKIADHYRLHVGRPMNKNEAHRLSRIVAKLEGPNGVWHRLK
ncbi:MAG: hypothetical protein ACTHNN_19615 [Xanthobacteraceae bacterium]